MRRIYAAVALALLCGSAYGQTLYKVEGLREASGSAFAKKRTQLAVTGTGDATPQMQLDGVNVLTALNLTIDSGDPLQLDAVGTGLALKGIGGTWVVPSNLGWKTSSGAANAVLGVVPGEESIIANLPFADRSADPATLHLGQQSGGSHFLIGWDAGVAVLTLSFDGISCVGGTFSGGITALNATIGTVNATVLNADEVYTAYAELTEAVCGTVSIDDLSIGTAITLPINTDNILGNPSLPSTSYLDIGFPTGDGLTWRTPGSVTAIYGLFKNDVHAIGGVYGSEGVIVGFGRQDHSHDGALWIASDGTDGVPTAGWQETKVRTTTSGCFFYNHAASAETGSVDQRFEFDDEVRATVFSGSGASLTNLPMGQATGTLADDNGGTGQSTYATGDMLYASAADTLAKRTIGSAGQVLHVSSGVPAWTSSPSVSALTVGGGSQILNHLVAADALDFGSIAAHTTAELTITATGAVQGPGNSCYVTPDNGIESGLVWSGYISAADTITVRLANVTTSAIDPASRDWTADVWAH